eukprot:2387646-Amphidinium_carterae.1
MPPDSAVAELETNDGPMSASALTIGAGASLFARVLSELSLLLLLGFVILSVDSTRKVPAAIPVAHLDLLIDEHF